jgi:hypothetical protein
MAQAPFSGVPTEKPTGPVGVTQSISANPGQFGGMVGQAEQQLGGQLQRTSEQVAHAAVQLQDANNTQAAREANIGFLNQMGQVYAEYASQKGKAAYDGLVPFQEKLGELYKQHAETVPNRGAREMFESSARYSMSQMLRSASVYAASQNRESLIKTNDAMMQTELQHAMLMSNNPNAIALSERNYVSAARDNAIQSGMTDVERDAYVQKAAGKFWHDMVLFKLNAPESQGGGPSAAKALFDQVKTKMDPDSLRVVSKAVEDKAETDAGISTGTKYFNDALSGVGAPSSVGAGTPGSPTKLDAINPRLKQISTPGGAKFSVAEEASDRFQGLVNDLEAAGYKVNPETSGGYNKRYIAGTQTPSQHAYGLAIDVNATSNPRGAGKSSDIPADLANRLAEKWGMTWGGNWKGETRDPMHFEVAGGGTPRVQQVAYKTNQPGSDQPLMVVGKPDGLVTPGNIDLNARPIVKNKDGSVSTVRSMSITDDNGQVILIPTVIGDKVVSDGEAMEHYRKTGQNLGIFDSLESADSYAESLHQQQEQYAATKATPRATGLTPSGAAYTANVQAQVAQAQADAYRRIMSDPNLSEGAKSAAMRHVNQQAQATLIALEAKNTAKKEMNNAAADTWTQKINAGATPDMIQQINNDPTITDWRTRDALIQMTMKKAGVEDTSSYGKAYTDLYKRIVAPDGTPDRVTTVNEILSHGGPDGDLTLPGVQKLVSVFQLTKKDVDQRGVHTTVSSLLTYARNQLSFEQDLGPIKIRDPKGEAIYNGDFVPKFEASFAAWQKAGKDPMQFLTRENVDKLIQGMRSKADMARDRLAASGEVAPGAKENPNAPNPPVPEGLNRWEWDKMMTAPPVASTGQPFTRAAWARVLKLLADNPDVGVRDFNEKFGAYGLSGEEILSRLKRETPPPAVAPFTGSAARPKF